MDWIYSFWRSSHAGYLIWGKGLRLVIFWFRNGQQSINAHLALFDAWVWTHTGESNNWENTSFSDSQHLTSQSFRPGLKDFILDFRECTNVDHLLLIQFFGNIVPGEFFLAILQQWGEKHTSGWEAYRCCPKNIGADPRQYCDTVCIFYVYGKSDNIYDITHIIILVYMGKHRWKRVKQITWPVDKSPHVVTSEFTVFHHWIIESLRCAFCLLLHLSICAEPKLHICPMSITINDWSITINISKIEIDHVGAPPRRLPKFFGCRRTPNQPTRNGCVPAPGRLVVLSFISSFGGLLISAKT